MYKDKVYNGFEFPEVVSPQRYTQMDTLAMKDRFATHYCLAWDDWLTLQTMDQRIGGQDGMLRSSHFWPNLTLPC